jgi:hypothetical protein
MYLDRGRCYYVGSEQRCAAGRFLLLLQLRGGGGPDGTFAVVRKVALRQFGAWMMGKARIHGKGKWATVSGSYGSDGLPMTVDELPPDAVLLPRHLYDAWNKGGGWNCAGGEAQAMREWANGLAFA